MKSRAVRAAEPGWQWRWGRRAAPSARPRAWNVEALRTLRALIEQNRSWSEIAMALNRSCSSVQRRAYERGLRRGWSG